MASGLLIPEGGDVAAVLDVPPRASRLLALLGLVRADRRLALPVAVLVAIVLFAIFAPVFWGQDPNSQSLLSSLSAPSWSHPMGTDDLGRDVFARVAQG